MAMRAGEAVIAFFESNAVEVLNHKFLDESVALFVVVDVDLLVRKQLAHLAVPALVTPAIGASFRRVVGVSFAGMGAEKLEQSIGKRHVSKVESPGGLSNHNCPLCLKSIY